MGDLTLASGVTVISLVAALIGIFLGPILANRMGKKNVYLLCIVISIIFTALRLIDVRSMTLIYISSLCGGIAGGCLQPLNTSIQADNTTYVQYKTGKRAEAAIASLTSFYHKGCPGTGRGDPRLCAGCLRICGGIGSAAGEHQYGNYLMRIDSADDSDRIGSDSFRNAVYAG